MDFSKATRENFICCCTIHPRKRQQPEKCSLFTSSAFLFYIGYGIRSQLWQKVFFLHPKTLSTHFNRLNDFRSPVSGVRVGVLSIIMEHFCRFNGPIEWIQVKMFSPSNAIALVPSILRSHVWWKKYNFKSETVIFQTKRFFVWMVSWQRSTTKWNQRQWEIKLSPELYVRCFTSTFQF